MGGGVVVVHQRAGVQQPVVRVVAHVVRPAGVDGMVSGLRHFGQMVRWPARSGGASSFWAHDGQEYENMATPSGGRPAPRRFVPSAVT